MSPLMVTKCCDAPCELKSVGEEIFIRCMACQKYIGHVVDRRIALLQTVFRSNIRTASQERNLDTEFSQDELDHLFDLYLEKLQNWTIQAARQAIKDYVPIENT